MIFVIRFFCLNNVCDFLLFDFLGSFIPFLFKKSKDWISVNPIGKSPFYFSQKPFSFFFWFFFWWDPWNSFSPLCSTFWSTINIGSDKKQKARHFYATLDAFEIVFKMHHICQLWKCLIRLFNIKWNKIFLYESTYCLIVLLNLCFAF